TAEQLDRALALVRDADRVVEEPLILKRLGVLRRVLRFHLNPHVVGDRLRGRRVERLISGLTHTLIISSSASFSAPASIARRSGGAHNEGRMPTITGKALIFWDLKVPGKKKKLDAIDTDQITPAADCVSESLTTLDERWKAGSFRYLMPDFRARVHHGENFLIASDRFAIGSSREMSPAGLKGVAEEVGLQMVIVCGSNMGDIFRRNAFNLGLEVAQCPEAVEDARDGDSFSFDPDSRRLMNETQGKT